MKQIFCIIFFVCTVFISNAQDFRANLNIGIPLNKFTNWTSPNYDVDLSFSKNVSDKFLLGIGSSYLAVDLLPSHTYLTFDRKVLSFFSSGVYVINISEKIKLLPQFRIGYSFIRSELNQFQDQENKTGGLYISQELYSTLKLSKNIDLLAGFSHSTIISKLESPTNLNIPQTYIDSDKKTISQFIIKIGCIYHF